MGSEVSLKTSIDFFRREVYEKLGKILEEKGDQGFIEEGPKIVEKFCEKHVDFLENLESVHCVEGYSRKKIICDNGKHAIRLMEWSPGCTSQIHEHGGRPCFDFVFSGELEVTNVKPIKVEKEFYELEELKKINVGPGDLVILNPVVDETEVHVVHNPKNKTAKSLHFYPIDHRIVGIYLFNGNGKFRREHYKLSDD